MSAHASTPSGAPAKPATAAARREKRQKQIVAVGSVLLLGLLGFQLPKLLGGDETSAPGTLPVPAPTAVVPAGTPTLPDTDRVVVRPQSGQLLSFGLFKSKDPFVQQIGTVASPTFETSSPTVTQASPQISTTPHVPPIRTAPPGGLIPASTTPAPVSFPETVSTTPAPTSFPETVSTTPVSTPPVAQTTTPSVPATTPGTVALSTNGLCELVPLKGKFPGSEDIFVLNWIAADSKTVRITVAGGAYETGQATATLKRGGRLTLVNTADGTRYVISLLASCDVATQPVPSSSPAPTTTSSAPRAPSPVATTAPVSQTPPSSSEIIVEDDLDTGEAETTATLP